MLSRLQRYQFNVVYKKGTSLHIADTLSRASLATLSTNNMSEFDIFRVEAENDYPNRHPNLKTETEVSLRIATQADDTLKLLYLTIQKAGLITGMILTNACDHIGITGMNYR